ncbi:phospholipase D-like domain-containing protein [Rhodoferax sediminis]|nr:phospholipase D family protein [Rhodoferax sediminis]
MKAKTMAKPRWCGVMIGRLHVCLVVLSVAILGGCASLPPGSDFPKAASSALTHPQETRLGQQFESAAREHGGNSGFRFVSAGADGFLIRMQMINAAQRTLDLQYFIFRGDETGRLLTDAVMHAADRGVRVRVLVDDGETLTGDDQLTVLEAHPSIEIRIFNPFAYRGHITLIRATEFMFNASRLDYRMHNKLLVVDNAIALIGGRNIGDQYFQIDPNSQFADDDVFAAGPIAQTLSKTFDEYWNSALAIPVQALSGPKASHAALNEHRDVLDGQRQELKVDGVDYVKRVATGEPFEGMISGRLPLIWAPAQVVCDSPDKKQVESGAMVGRLMQRAVAQAVGAAQSELLMITPYLIPGKEGMKMFKDLREHNVRVRLLTSSLEAATVLLAQSGYMHYRAPLLEDGVELYEIRSLLGNTKGSGETRKMSRYGNYSLHAKLFVVDRQRLFVGSMNFDQRSMHLNTEIGLIIDSPVLAQQIAARFEAMVQPANSYRLTLRQNDARGAPSGLVWHTQEDGKLVEYDTEPARSEWQRAKVNLLSLLPMDREL